MKINRSIALIFAIALIPGSIIQGWGFTAHMRINSDAVDTLPSGMKEFFERERSFVSEHSVDPDLWKKDDKM